MPINMKSGRYLLKSFVWIGITYVSAFVVAIIVLKLLGNQHLLVKTFIADAAATVVVFLFGRIFHNASFYDPYWSLAPLAISFYWSFDHISNPMLTVQQLIVLALVSLWGLRLTYNWASQWQGLKHEDWRYREYRQSTGGLFWLVELVGIELMPTIFVFMGCLSLYPVLTSNIVVFGPFTLLGALVTLSAIIIEATADRQLKRFIDSQPASGSIMNIGLWKYSRHPNYLGEILFWWGLWVFVLGTASSNWLAVIGPLSITCLFIFVSIPLMEKRNLLRRSGYAEHQKRVSVLIPWFKKD